MFKHCIFVVRQQLTMTAVSQQRKVLLLVSAIFLLAGFFLPWLNWLGTNVAGYHFPTGGFFAASEKKFDLANPFPQYAVFNHAFWLIPVGALLIGWMAISDKKTNLLICIPSIMALALITIYLRFTQSVVDYVGTVKSLLPTIQMGLYATALGAIGIIIGAMPRQWTLKLLLVVLGPAVAWMGFNFLNNKLNGDHAATGSVKSAYTVTLSDMLGEFASNDTLADKKYTGRVVTVSGPVSEVETPTDSTVNLKMTDPAGSYIIFSFDPAEAAAARQVKPGQSMTLKGYYGGSSYSDILESRVINFNKAIITTP